jgi:hypothetical protein
MLLNYSSQDENEEGGVKKPMSKRQKRDQAKAAA